MFLNIDLITSFLSKVDLSMADSGFPGGTAKPTWGANLLFGIIFAKNCMKMPMYEAIAVEGLLSSGDYSWHLLAHFLFRKLR